MRSVSPSYPFTNIYYSIQAGTQQSSVSSKPSPWQLSSPHTRSPQHSESQSQSPSPSEQGLSLEQQPSSPEQGEGPDTRLSNHYRFICLSTNYAVARGSCQQSMNLWPEFTMSIRKTQEYISVTVSSNTHVFDNNHLRSRIRVRFRFRERHNCLSRRSTPEISDDCVLNYCSIMQAN